MARIYDPAVQTIFHAANRYPRSNEEARAMGLSGKRNEEMRAMTIAAIRVAQNETQIDDRIMDSDLLILPRRRKRFRDRTLEKRRQA